MSSTGLLVRKDKRNLRNGLQYFAEGAGNHRRSRRLIWDSIRTTSGDAIIRDDLVVDGTRNGVHNRKK